MNKSSQKTYTNEGNSEVLERLPPNFYSVLDLGCGAGDNARRIKEQAPSSFVDGITISEAEVPLAGRFCRHVLVHNLELGLPENCGEQYDVIIASHVLEHICYPEALLAHISKHLAPDGVFIVALPNVMCWRYRLRILLGDFEYTESGVMDYTHFRWYTFKSAQILLKKHGFFVRNAAASGGLPLGILRKIIPTKVQQKLDNIACKLIPGLFGHQMIFVAKRAS